MLQAVASNVRRLLPRGRRIPPAVLAAAACLVAAWAVAATPEAHPYGAGAEYRTLFDPATSAGKLLNPRNIVWVLAQLHLLFGAFVLAVPMFVVIIELVGLLSKDPEQSRRFDALGLEFTRLLTTAFSATAILGAIFTFVTLGLYPKLFNFLVEVFGPTMYLYSCIFFGESFSLYLYYYGWGKFNRWLHWCLGLFLNAFGITLMLIANAWTTFMMAPGASVDAHGVVVDRHAAFFNFLLTPINIHRLIANFCMGGSVAAAYAAFKFLSAKTDAERAHYDWMGYIGNFIAILFLLPLPFAGYYLGFEIYGYNQQLGIYMMGGILSWLFIMQAVLIGVLFLAANYYLWLGMDRIEGAERYRGWIKFLLAVITLGVIVWGTPHSLILTSGEIERQGGTAHPILSIFGVMSAKNTAVNLIILSTFLSFILYRRGNKVPTVKWATLGKAVQAAAFGLAAAVVVFIGIGGYVPSLWLESSKRISMSPKQVIAVLVCMAIVMPIDILMFRGAKEIGKIRWGKVSRRSQYTLILLAVSFTWLMGLMGFVRSSLRQHWHVYEVMKDESPWAFTPAIGYATIIITITVAIFFGLVSLIFWIATLGAHEAEETAPSAAPAALAVPPARHFPRPAWIGAASVVLLVLVVMVVRSFRAVPPTASADKQFQELLKKDEARRQAIALQLGAYVRDEKSGKYRLPIDRAVEMVVTDPALLQPVAFVPPPPGADPAERGEMIFTKVQPCGTCHSVDGSPKTGPTMLHLFMSTQTLADGTTVTADEAFLRESIKDPTAKVEQGFQPLMPPLPLADDEIDALIAYIKKLQ